ncbi:hypothetical protein LEP1GSC061_2801 [Leptospira wolffii serovar Khorat str. Khorat-H2]|nr:hypothetical protein LEP1GSC061_2801 [Leptospira wolffii serovar Khorat str. Khorat-H2]
MNPRPNSEIADRVPDLETFRPDFPHKEKLGRLLESYADSLLEPRSEKVILLSEANQYRN